MIFIFLPFPGNILIIHITEKMLCIDTNLDWAM